MRLFEVLKLELSNQTAQNETEERLRRIMEEAEDMKTQVEDKLRQIQGSSLISICCICSVGYV